MSAFPPPPIINAISGADGKVTQPWNLYFQQLTQVVDTNNAVTVTVDNTNSTSTYVGLYNSATGNISPKSNSGLTYNAATHTLTAVAFIGALNGNADTSTSSLAAGTSTNTTNTAITDDNSTNATMYPTWVTSNSGNLPQNVSSAKLRFNPASGTLTSNIFQGALTGAASGNVVGPSSSLDNCIPTWDGTTGLLLKDSTLKLITTTGLTRGTDTTTVRNRFALGVADCAEFFQSSTLGHAFGSTLTVRRVADYVGTATSGWFNSGINVLTTVSAGANTGTANEVGVTAAVRSDGGGYNCGVFGQAWRQSGTGWMWGLIGDAQDQTGAESAYPVNSCELDCFGNGINTTYHNRIGLMVVTGMPTIGSTGVASQCWHGIYLTATNADNTQGYFKHGLHVGHDESLGPSYTRLTCDVGVKILADGTYGLWDAGSKTNGLRLEGTYSGTALIVNATTGNHLPAGNAAGAIQVAGADSGSAVFQTDSFAGSGNLIFRRADGTAASPSAVQLDDGLGFIGARGYGATAYSSGNRANIKFGVGSNWNDANHETYVALSVTPNGSTTLAEIARFNSGGLVINASMASATLPTRETGVLLQTGNADATVTAIELDSFGAANQYLGKRAGGTIASKTALAVNNVLVQLSGLGYDGSAYSSIAGSLQIAAAGTWSGIDHSTYMAVRLTSIGSTSIAEVARFTDAGNEKIGGTANRGTTEGTNHLDLYDGTPPVGTLANGFSLYSSGGQAYVKDSLGVASLVSTQKSVPAISATKTANFTVLSYTPPAAAGLYKVGGVITTTSATNTGTVQLTVDYKDSQGTAHTATVLRLSKSDGTTNTTQTGASQEFPAALMTFTIDNSATAIVLKVVITGTVSYTVTGFVELVA